uniref:SMP-30/gluconolactonase/LRE family protein n=1 Tax=Phenylobacterium glaciei TaxID=2803784 RepID=A0A974P728_9CAUL|nr:SMP-30/gluconolactonase/LRE family protein [Phenylobacterium glaciei]
MRKHLGEGPCWDEAAGRLYWFDIRARRLHWLEPSTNLTGEALLPLRASAGAVCSDGTLLLATEAGLATFSPSTLEFELIYLVAVPAGFRSNDGKLDRQGRFWWSMMDDNEGERPGSVYRTNPDGSTAMVLDGIHIPNTLACSADGQVLFIADSKLQTIFTHDVDALGRLSRQRVFAHTRGEVGTPDGAAIDAEGYLWSAQWGRRGSFATTTMA